MINPEITFRDIKNGTGVKERNWTMSSERAKTNKKDGILHDWIYARKIVSMKSKRGALRYRNLMVMYCLTILGALAHGGEDSACLGVNLGKRIVHAPTRFGPVRSKDFLQSDNVLGPESFMKVNCKPVRIMIDRPFFGLSEATASCDENGLVIGFTVKGSFRRGMPRAESFAKILELKEEVTKRIGFEVGEYSFSAQGYQNGLEGSAAGRTLWMDMDSVYAYVCSTNEDIEVSLRCSVNSGVAKKPELRLGGDSPVEFNVQIVKASIRDSEVRRMQDVREREERLRNLKLSEFYGVDFKLPLQCMTNSLVRKEFPVETWHDGHTNRFVHVYWERMDRTLRPAAFFDFAQIEYSHRSRVAEEVSFYGHFSKEASRKECIVRLNEFAGEMNDRYGIVIKDITEPPNEVEPVDFIRRDFPVNDERDVSRYHFDCKNRFFCREFQNGNVFIRLEAGDTSYGERCVVLTCMQMAHDGGS